MDMEKLSSAVRKKADDYFESQSESAGEKIIEVFLFPHREDAVLLLARAESCSIPDRNRIHVLVCDGKDWPRIFVGKKINSHSQETILEAARELHKEEMCLDGLTHERAFIISESGEKAKFFC